MRGDDRVVARVWLIVELLKFDDVSVRVSDKKTVDTKLLQAMRRPVGNYTSGKESFMAGIHVAGDEADHAAPGFNHAPGESLANSDAGSAHDPEYACAARVATTLQTEQILVKI